MHITRARRVRHALARLGDGAQQREQPQRTVLRTHTHCYMADSTRQQHACRSAAACDRSSCRSALLCRVSSLSVSVDGTATTAVAEDAALASLLVLANCGSRFARCSKYTHQQCLSLQCTDHIRIMVLLRAIQHDVNSRVLIDNVVDIDGSTGRFIDHARTPQHAVARANKLGCQ
jgi:hypothetical protein